MSDVSMAQMILTSIDASHRFYIDHHRIKELADGLLGTRNGRPGFCPRRRILPALRRGAVPGSCDSLYGRTRAPERRGLAHAPAARWPEDLLLDLPRRFRRVHPRAPS